MRPLTKRLCIVLWALWAVLGAVSAIAALVDFTHMGKNITIWIGVASASGFLLVLLQYLLTGLWRPADLLK